MLERETQILRNLIIKSSNDNNGDLVHKYVKKKTSNLVKLQELSSVLETIFDVSLFAGCREYIRLSDLTKNGQTNESELKAELQEIAENIVYEKIQGGLESNNVNMCCEAILALYAIGDNGRCTEFFNNSTSPARYVFNITEICLYDNILSTHVYDIVLFLFQATKCIDDFSNSKCIRAVRFNAESAGLFMEQKKVQICNLAKWYFEQEQYISLSSLMRMFEIDKGNSGRYKRVVYEYIGISKEEFLEKALKNGSARALDFYFLVKYNEEFPDLEDIMPILKLETSASVYCIVRQCLKRIMSVGDIDKRVSDILYWMKDKMRKKQLFFDYQDEYNDRGIDNGLLKRNIEKAFQLLCREKKDVNNFVFMISFFNIFRNAELRLDYNITKDETVRYSDWKQEYDYICERYQNRNGSVNEVVYVVMNTYLRFYVDIVELYTKYSGELRDYWFPGYVTNEGVIKLFQQRYNVEFAKKRYTVIRTDSNKYVKKTPEELQYIRFKICKIDLDKREIYIDEVQTISSELSNVISKVLFSLLRSGYITKAYNYLKSFDATDQNLYRHDRYTAISEKPKPWGEPIEKLFEKNVESYKQYLCYIYFNSYVKTFVPLDSVKGILDSNSYLLGDVTLSDNMNYQQEEYYYISPNYYNPNKMKFRILKSKLSPELNTFISRQLEMFKNESEKKSRFQTVRVCFYIESEAGTTDSKEVSKMYLHCCEQEIKDLSAVLITYYSRIYKINRSGIASNVIKKYMNVYKDYARENQNWFNDEWKKFFHIYLRFLHMDLSSVNKNANYYSRWAKNGSSYNDINIFVMTQDELLNELTVDEEIQTFLISDKYYSLVLEDLKSCQDMRFFVYDKTVFRFLFESYDAFYEMVDSM